jgi:hypothetical protein
MGQGIEMARGLGPEHAALIDNLKDQLLIVFLKRLKAKGDDLRFHVSEVDDTGQDMLAFNVVNGTFNFELKRKS